MDFQQYHVSPEQLLLDPNNYRFHDIAGYRPVNNQARYGEPGVQERAIQLLQNTESFELESLKDSIVTNGYQSNRSSSSSTMGRRVTPATSWLRATVVWRP